MKTCEYVPKRLARRIRAFFGSCSTPKNDASDEIGLRKSQSAPLTMMAAIVAMRYVCDNPCNVPPKPRNRTRIGSISKMTLDIRIAIISMNGKRITPRSNAGPKWNGVNGKVPQDSVSFILTISESNLVMDSFENLRNLRSSAALS